MIRQNNNKSKSSKSRRPLRSSKSRRPLRSKSRRPLRSSHKKNDVSFKFKSNKYNVLTYDPKKELPTTNPFDMVDYKFWTKRWWSSFLRTYDPKKWEPYVKDVMSYYLPKLKKVNDVYFIPKGTLLYHSSHKSDISEYNNKRLTFFGFDANISIWYILEMMLNTKQLNKPVPKHYYLHEFKLDNDIRITKLWNTMLKNPLDVKECLKYDSVCVHPQLVFHGMSINTKKHELYDLSLEVTLFVKKYINSVLKKNRLFLVDPLILNKNSNNKNFNPFDNITLVNNNEKYNF